MNDISVLNLFLEAGMVVKTVMVILLIASLLTWIVIVERYNFYKKIRVINDSFLERFWSGEDLNLLYSEIKTETVPVYGALSVFKMPNKWPFMILTLIKVLLAQYNLETFLHP